MHRIEKRTRLLLFQLLKINFAFMKKNHSRQKTVLKWDLSKKIFVTDGRTDGWTHRREGGNSGLDSRGHEIFNSCLLKKNVFLTLGGHCIELF